MLLQKLKVDTLAAHRKTERFFYGKEIMSGTLTRTQYGEMIQKNHYIFSMVEPKIAEVFSKLYGEETEFLPATNRRDFLAADLRELEINPVDFTVDMPALDNKAVLTGALYVIEGSMLGGQMIGKKLADNVALPDAEGLHFYRPHRKDTGTRWRNFCNFAESQGEDLDYEDVLRGALETFSFFQKVYGHSLRVTAQ